MSGKAAVDQFAPAKHLCDQARQKTAIATQAILRRL